MKHIINFLLALYAFFSFALVVQFSFEWFITPVFDVKPLQYLQALAIVFFSRAFPTISTKGFVIAQHVENTWFEKEDEEEVYESLIKTRLLHPWLIFIIIFFLHLLFNFILWGY